MLNLSDSSQAIKQLQDGIEFICDETLKRTYSKQGIMVKGNKTK